MGSERILGRLAWGCGLDSTGSGQGPVEGCGECGNEHSGSCATELVRTTGNGTCFSEWTSYQRGLSHASSKRCFHEGHNNRQFLEQLDLQY
jgi:hypothetical protein